MAHRLPQSLTDGHLMKLTETNLRRLADGWHADNQTPRLYAFVADAGRKRSWLLRFTSPATGKRRAMGLGAIGAVTLEGARRLAHRANELLADGRDPIDERAARIAAQRAADAGRRARRKPVTFGEVARAFHASRSAQWRSGVHAANWLSSVRRVAKPDLWELDVADVDAAALLRAFGPTWTKTPDTARRVLRRVGQALAYAAGPAFSACEPPNAMLAAVLAALPDARALSAQRARHHYALEIDVTARVARAAYADPSPTARALLLVMLTATRAGEALGSRWGEFDLDGGLWTVPSARMKAGREHRVPLPPQCVRMLRAMREDCALDAIASDAPLFAGVRGDQLRSLLKNLSDDPRATVHGLRSVFRDWAGDRGAAFDLAEAVLAHAVGSAVARAYARGDRLELRRRLMDDWGSALLPRAQLLEFKQA
jgi:integrase